MRANHPFFLLFFLAFFALPSYAAEAPKINSYVVDNAGVFGPGIGGQLDSALRQVEAETNGVQFIVYTEKSIPSDESLESWTLKIAEKNGIGKAENDNGILFYLATEDRQFRWEVGYGVESTLNAALLGRISREYMIPEFQEGRYDAGIVAGVEAASKILLGSQDPDIVRLQEEARKDMKVTWASALILLASSLSPFIIFMIIALIIYVSAKKSSKRGKKDDSYFRDAATWLFLGNMMGSGRGPRGGLGGGGFGGGGFSGGGGSFGGGGFSGRF